MKKLSLALLLVVFLSAFSFSQTIQPADESNANPKIGMAPYNFYITNLIFPAEVDHKKLTVAFDEFLNITAHAIWESENNRLSVTINIPNSHNVIGKHLLYIKSETKTLTSILFPISAKKPYLRNIDPSGFVFKETGTLAITGENLSSVDSLELRSQSSVPPIVFDNEFIQYQANGDISVKYLVNVIERQEDIPISVLVNSRTYQGFGDIIQEDKIPYQFQFRVSVFPPSWSDKMTLSTDKTYYDELTNDQSIKLTISLENAIGDDYNRLEIKSSFLERPNQCNFSGPSARNTTIDLKVVPEKITPGVYQDVSLVRRTDQKVMFKKRILFLGKPSITTILGKTNNLIINPFSNEQHSLFLVGDNLLAIMENEISFDSYPFEKLVSDGKIKIFIVDKTRKQKSMTINLVFQDLDPNRDQRMRSHITLKKGNEILATSKEMIELAHANESISPIDLREAGHLTINPCPDKKLVTYSIGKRKTTDNKDVAVIGGRIVIDSDSKLEFSLPDKYLTKNSGVQLISIQIRVYDEYGVKITELSKIISFSPNQNTPFDIKNELGNIEPWNTIEISASHVMKQNEFIDPNVFKMSLIEEKIYVQGSWCFFKLAPSLPAYLYVLRLSNASKKNAAPDETESVPTNESSTSVSNKEEPSTAQGIFGNFGMGIRFFFRKNGRISNGTLGLYIMGLNPFGTGTTTETTEAENPEGKTHIKEIQLNELAILALYEYKLAQINPSISVPFQIGVGHRFEPDNAFWTNTFITFGVGFSIRL